MPEHVSTSAPRTPSRGWRIGTPLVVLAAGALFVVSALNSDGTDLRPGRYTNLSQLVASEANRYQRIEQQVNELNNEVNALTAQVSDASVKRLQRRASAVSSAAGMTEVSGAGVTITMSDAPDSVIDHADSDEARWMVVHQQDVQAVINALWRGGAQAITIAGQRIISTTGIKCTGSTITLQGVPYPQPFVIEAVGDIDTLSDALENDTYVSLYRAQADDPAIRIGWDLTSSDDVRAPAYSGLRDLNYAQPINPSE